MRWTSTKKRCRFSRVRRILCSQYYQWRHRMWRRHSPVSWWELRKKWRDTSLIKKQRMQDFNNKSLPSRERRQPCNSSYSDFKEESLNWKCKSEMKITIDNYLYFERILCLFSCTHKSPSRLIPKNCVFYLSRAILFIACR